MGAFIKHKKSVDRNIKFTREHNANNRLPYNCGLYFPQWRRTEVSLLEDYRKINPQRPVATVWLLPLQWNLVQQGGEHPSQSIHRRSFRKEKEDLNGAQQPQTGLSSEQNSMLKKRTQQGSQSPMQSKTALIYRLLWPSNLFMNTDGPAPQDNMQMYSYICRRKATP